MVRGQDYAGDRRRFSPAEEGNGGAISSRSLSSDLISAFGLT
jgi:hypothetical protein